MLLLKNVFALPFFVSIISNDEDVVYGLNDRLVNLTVRLNSKDHIVYVDFSAMETSGNGTQKVINNGDGTYTVNYTILSPSSTNPINLSVTAFDPKDNSKLMDIKLKK